ncbi:hypothetical protein DKX38_024234 [Salix brachista]|uniref:Uncharacterized protein n=1 Tax=Salix brachista TaxID=2182728 RepID=A0A5N5JS11_9ROSI|nr:hypothetical protein DKX38_024234 [Salix brachista]
MPTFYGFRNGEEIVKRRRVSLKEKDENSESGDEYFTVIFNTGYCVVGSRSKDHLCGFWWAPYFSPVRYGTGLGLGIRRRRVVGLGLGIRRRRAARFGISNKNGVLSPSHTDQPASGKHRSSLVHHGSTNLPAQVSQFPGSYVKEIACGGRHSAVVTDSTKTPCLESKLVRMVNFFLTGVGIGHAILLVAYGSGTAVPSAWIVYFVLEAQS